jgi:hypothetical protein
MMNKIETFAEPIGVTTLYKEENITGPSLGTIYSKSKGVTL